MCPARWTRFERRLVRCLLSRLLASRSSSLTRASAWSRFHCRDVVTYDGAAFAAIAVGLVADVAAGAATLRTLPVDAMALTAGVDSTMTASTRGDRLSARARLRERDETRLIFDAVVEVSSVGQEPRSVAGVW